MQHKLRTDPDLAKLNLTVVDVRLVNKAGNEYKGIATVKTQDGTEHDVPVDVTADGNNVLWETPPGAFLFALRDTPEPPLPPSPAPPASSVPGADAQGFLGGPRCIDQAALIIRTPQSGVVICADNPGTYLYEGLRLKDGGRMTLPAVPTSTGFAATNPSDGTRYEVSREGLTIYTHGDVYTEQATAAGP